MFVFLMLASSIVTAEPAAQDVNDLMQMMQQYETLKSSAPVSDYEMLQAQIQGQQAEIAKLQAEKAFLAKELERLRAACPGK